MTPWFMKAKMLKNKKNMHPNYKGWNHNLYWYTVISFKSTDTEDFACLI